MPFENPWNNLPKAEFVYDTLSPQITAQCSGLSFRTYTMTTDSKSKSYEWLVF